MAQFRVTYFNIQGIFNNTIVSASSKEVAADIVNKDIDCSKVHIVRELYKNETNGQFKRIQEVELPRAN